MFTLGIDLGSSSIKASALEVESGKCVGSATFPEQEMEIMAPGAEPISIHRWAELSTGLLGSKFRPIGTLDNFQLSIINCII